MTIPRRPFVALLVMTVAGCGGGAAATPATSSAPASSGLGLAGPDPFRESLAALVLPPDSDLLRNQLAEAIDLRGALGDEAENVLSVIADAERVAYPGPPEIELPAPEADPSTGFATLASFDGIRLPPAARPPTKEIEDLLPGALDNVGRGGPQAARAPSTNGGETARGHGVAATVTVRMDAAASITGSALTLTLGSETTWSVVEDPGGAPVLAFSSTHDVVAVFDVCPTVQGDSIASLDQVLTVESTTHAGRFGRVGTHATGSIDSTSDFRGMVDDSATLGAVTQNYHRDEQWIRTAAAVDGPEARHEGSLNVTFSGIGAGSAAAAQGAPPKPGDFSTVEATIDSSGDATQQLVAEAGVAAAYDFTTMAPAFVAAETLWQNSRCVIVAVPEYEAVSEFAVRHQGFVDHTENVDAGSETPFEAAVQHRFGQNVTASLEAQLSGDDALTPESIERPPGTLTYTAPGEEGATATVRMQSTSKQGIGILAIGFETGVQGYEVTLVRKTSGGPWDPTTLTLSAVIKPGADEGVFEGTGRGSGTLLEFDFDASSCKQSAYSGESLIVAQLVGDMLVIYSQLTDPFIIGAGILSGDGREAGGTTHQEREAELGPGEAPPVGATCYAYSAISQTITVKPLAPEE